MKNRFLKICAVIALACTLGIGGYASAQPIVDNTEDSVTTQISILRERQAGVRRGKAIVESTFNLPAAAPEVTLTLPDMPDGLLGSYELHSRLLSVSNRDAVNSYAALITFHEIGHWFDNRVMAPRFTKNAGDTSEASVDLTVHELDAWRAAIRASRTWRGLLTLLKSTPAKTPRAQFLQYVMTPEEMWACSFCQYVAGKSGDPLLQAQMSTFVQSDWPWNGSWYPDDFKPIGKALDDLFTKNGWLRQPSRGDIEPGP